MFNAAGLLGRGIFTAAAEQSDVQGRQLWGTGVDVDWLFDVPVESLDHVLTSMIKRQDTAAFLVIIAANPVWRPLLSLVTIR